MGGFGAYVGQVEQAAIPYQGGYCQLGRRATEWYGQRKSFVVQRWDLQVKWTAFQQGREHDHNVAQHDDPPQSPDGGPAPVEVAHETGVESQERELQCPEAARGPMPPWSAEHPTRTYAMRSMSNYLQGRRTIEHS